MSYMETSEFEEIYNKLPKTGVTTCEFAEFTADSESQKIFKNHFERIKLINCRQLNNNTNSGSASKCEPVVSSIELFSGPAALKLANDGKKVAVLIFADSTNVGGIYMTGGNPAGTQEEQTVLMAPEIYGYLGNNYGIKDIGGKGAGIYSAKQKRYCTNKDDYENPEFINPAYGFILANLLMTHKVEYRSSMIKLPKENVVEVSYAFLSMPSFATDISYDPVGAALIGQSEEKDGNKIYDNMRRAIYGLREDTELDRNDYSLMRRDIGKISLFYSVNKLKDFSNKYLKDVNSNSIGDIIYNVIKANYMIKNEITEAKLKEKLRIEDFSSFKNDTINIVNEARKNYEDCLMKKFSNLIRGAEESNSDTLVLGKIGCGAFMNKEEDVAKCMGKALLECKSIKHIYFAGTQKDDPFINNVKSYMKK